MRTASQTRAAGRTKITGVGDALTKGGPTAGQRGGREVKGRETYDRRTLAFRKLNNADPGPKI